MIVIVAEPYIGFPNGTAATSRVAAYARGLAAAGEDVHVIMLGPSELQASTAVNTEVTGVFRGVPFEYTSVSTIKSPHLITRKWRIMTSLRRARRRIRELDERSGVDAVLLYGSATRTGAFFDRVARSVGALYVLSLVEMPYHGLPAGPSRDARQVHHGETFLRRFDVIVAISTYLAGYARTHARPSAEVIVVPILVDSDDYRTDQPPAHDPRLMVYVGMLNEAKDGVATLMRAFAEVSPDFPDVVLRLVGDSDDERVSNVPEFRRIAEDLGIADRVLFTGQVRREDVPRHLRDASVLVLARPASQQADAGFPTKLGEFLASGRPVVVTATSDIAAYLTDGRSAFLVPPGDVGALAAGMRRSLSDPEGSAVVGACGRQVAERSFDYRVAVEPLADTIRRLRPQTR